MSLRDDFEKLFPVPEGTKWDETIGEYNFEVCRVTHENELKRDDFIEYSALWKGFQAGHAAGLEAAAKYFDTLDKMAFYSPMGSAAAIRRHWKVAGWVH